MFSFSFIQRVFGNMFEIEVGKKYLFLYDDKGRKVVKKVGELLSKQDWPLFTLRNEYNNGHPKIEFLNAGLVIRGEEVDER